MKGKAMSARLSELLAFEKEILAQGYRTIAGVDEVGRGPLAGPVAVCAAVMDLTRPVDGVDDSKKLSEKKREELYPLLQNSAIDYRIVTRSPQEIDRVNILRATISAMEEAVLALDPKPDVVLVDAVKLNVPYPVRAIVGGDAKSYSIASASILAKVFRDRLMIEKSASYPEYCFDKNKGYGTKEHIDAIRNFGITPEHRLSFVGNSWDGNRRYGGGEEREAAADRAGKDGK